MIGTQNDMQSSFFHGRESFRQSLLSFVVDAIDDELRIVSRLLSESDGLLEIIDNVSNAGEITDIVNDLNSEIYTHVSKMNTLRKKMRKSQ